MESILATVLTGVIAGGLASVAASFLAKWLSNWRWKVTLKIGPAMVKIDLSEPDRIPALIDAFAKNPRVFLAYSHKDREFVDRLANDLKNRGLRVWYDLFEIRPGDSLTQRVNEGLSTSGYMLAVRSCPIVGGNSFLA